MSGLIHSHRPVDPLVTADQTWSSAGRLVTDVALGHEARWRWWIAFGVAVALIGVLAGSVGWLLWEGVGVWSNNIPVAWALDIVGYDWWIGVATGSLAVSALLLLTGADWRGGVNRLAETTALLSVAAAGLYPIIHLGRPWLFYWNLPYPNTFLLWPQFRSPLYWDAVDIISFLGISFLFWYTGLIPDLASMRDRAIEAMVEGQDRPGTWTRRLKAQLYGICALGWRGSVPHWQRWEHCYRAMAVFSLILVISLQTGAAVMFAGTAEPGWHDVMLPVSYLLGAVFAGVGTVAALLAVVRGVFPLRPVVTTRHFDLLAWLLLALAVLNLYCYAASFLVSALAGSPFDKALLGRRFTGQHSWATWGVIVCSLVPPHLFWFARARRSGLLLAAVGLLVAFGMWCDHFMVIVITLQHDFLPSAAHPYAVDVAGVAMFAGTVGLFLFLMLLFLRYVPIVSVVSLRWMLPALPLQSGPVRRG